LDNNVHDNECVICLDHVVDAEIYRYDCQNCLRGPRKIYHTQVKDSIGKLTVQHSVCKIGLRNIAVAWPRVQSANMCDRTIWIFQRYNDITKYIHVEDKRRFNRFVIKAYFNEKYKPYIECAKSNG
jgi:hypothetical protein